MGGYNILSHLYFRPDTYLGRNKPLLINNHSKMASFGPGLVNRRFKWIFIPNFKTSGYQFRPATPNFAMNEKDIVVHDFLLAAMDTLCLWKSYAFCRNLRKSGKQILKMINGISSKTSTISANRVIS